MPLNLLERPSLPVPYAELVLQIAEEHGISNTSLLKGIPNIDRTLSAANGRLSVLQYSELVGRLVTQAQLPAAGYELGLQMQVTTNGLLGYGFLCSNNVGEAIRQGAAFIQLQTATFSLQIKADGDDWILELVDLFPQAPWRRQAIDAMVVGLGTLLGEAIANSNNNKLQLMFCDQQPEYFAEYKNRLPTTLFNQAQSGLLIPAELWNQKLPAASQATADLVWQQCQQELALLGYNEDIVARVYAEMTVTNGEWPSLQQVAARLNVSTATLKRHLSQHGTSFRQLLNDARKRQATQLLQQSGLSIAQIASHLGYSEPANFSRAFRSWVGKSPQAYRER